MHDRHRVSAEGVSPWIAGALLAVPPIAAYYPPMSDLPQHEACIGLLRHFADPQLSPPGFYRLNLGHPNQLFYALGWILSLALSTRWTVKVLVAAAAAAIPVTAGRLARHLGVSPLAALAVTPVAYGWMFARGLVTSLIGLAVLLAALPELDLFAARPSARGLARCVLASTLLYFAHEAMLLVFAAASLGLAALHGSSRRGPWSETALRLVPPALAAAAVFGQARWQRSHPLAAFLDLPDVQDSLVRKIEILPSLAVQSTDAVVIGAVSVLWVLTMAVFVSLRRAERAPGASAPPGSGVSAWLLARRWPAFVAACVLAYLASPMTLNGAGFVYHRWFGPGFAVLTLIAAPRDLRSRAARPALALLAAIPLATVAVALPAFADSDREYRSLDAVAPLVAPGSSVAGVDLGPADPARTYGLDGAPGHLLATRGGRLAFGFSSSPISPVVPERACAWPRTTLRFSVDPWSLCPGEDLRRFRYALLRAGDSSLARAAVRSLGREARYVATEGEWMLFESRLPPLPACAAEETDARPCTDTLRARLLAALPEELDRRAAGSSEAGWPTPRNE
jgi:hypothetical protein